MRHGQHTFRFRNKHSSPVGVCFLFLYFCSLIFFVPMVTTRCRVCVVSTLLGARDVNVVSASWGLDPSEITRYLKQVKNVGVNKHAVLMLWIVHWQVSKEGAICAFTRRVSYVSAHTGHCAVSLPLLMLDQLGCISERYTIVWNPVIHGCQHGCEMVPPLPQNLTAAILRIECSGLDTQGGLLDFFPVWSNHVWFCDKLHEINPELQKGSKSCSFYLLISPTTTLQPT